MLWVAKRAALDGQRTGQRTSLNLVLFARPKYVEICMYVCITAKDFVYFTLDVFVLASVDFSFIFEV